MLLKIIAGGVYNKGVNEEVIWKALKAGRET